MTSIPPSNPEGASLSENSDNSDNSGYEFALQLAFYEGQISWQMNVLFVGLNIGIATILQDKLKCFSSYDFTTILLSFFGLIINICWLGTFLRNNRYYNFRMAQARLAEPETYKLVSDRGFFFSKGRPVIIPENAGNKKSFHKLTAFEKICTNKLAIHVSIWCFISGFLLLLLLSFIPCLK